MNLPIIVAILSILFLVAAVSLIAREEIQSIKFWREFKRRNKDFDRAYDDYKRK